MLREYKSNNLKQEEYIVQYFQNCDIGCLSVLLPILSILAGLLSFPIGKSSLYGLVQIYGISTMTSPSWLNPLCGLFLLQQGKWLVMFLHVWFLCWHLVYFVVCFLTMLYSSACQGEHRIMQYPQIYKFKSLPFLAMLAGTFYKICAWLFYFPIRL